MSILNHFSIFVLLISWKWVFYLWLINIRRLHLWKRAHCYTLLSCYNLWSCCDLGVAKRTRGGFLCILHLFGSLWMDLHIVAVWCMIFKLGNQFRGKIALLILSGWSLFKHKLWYCSVSSILFLFPFPFLWPWIFPRESIFGCNLFIPLFLPS